MMCFDFKLTGVGPGPAGEAGVQVPVNVSSAGSFRSLIRVNSRGSGGSGGTGEGGSGGGGEGEGGGGGKWAGLLEEVAEKMRLVCQLLCLSR